MAGEHLHDSPVEHVRTVLAERQPPHVGQLTGLCAPLDGAPVHPEQGGDLVDGHHIGGHAWHHVTMTHPMQPKSLMREISALRKLTHDGQRSEERRVGKECRSRWSPY